METAYCSTTRVANQNVRVQSSAREEKVGYLTEQDLSPIELQT